MDSGERDYIWSIEELLDLNNRLNRIEGDIKEVKLILKDKEPKPKDLVNDWKVLVIASLTIIGAIIAIAQA